MAKYINNNPHSADHLILTALSRSSPSIAPPALLLPRHLNPGHPPGTSARLSLPKMLECLLRKRLFRQISLSRWHPSELSFFGPYSVAVDDVAFFAALHQTPSCATLASAQQYRQTNIISRADKFQGE